MAAAQKADVVPNLDMEITVDNLKEGALAVGKLLKQNLTGDNIVMDDKSDGFVNKNFYCHTPGKKDGFMIRIVSQQVPGILDRTLNAMRYLMRHNLGAKLLCTFKNGVVMEFIHGEPITWDTFVRIKDPDIWKGVAHENARYHSSTDLKDVEELNIIDTPKNNRALTEEFCSSMKNGIIPKSILDKLPFTVDDVIKARCLVYDHLQELGAEVAFCHMDTNPTNVVISEDRGPVLIDYDMCLLEYVAIALSGLMSSILNIKTQDDSKLPTEQEKDVFFREYLAKRSELEPQLGPVTELQVAQLKVLVEKASLMSYINICLAVTFIQILPGKECPLDYTQTYWKKYVDNRDRVLALKLPEK